MVFFIITVNVFLIDGALWYLIYNLMYLTINLNSIHYLYFFY